MAIPFTVTSTSKADGDPPAKVNEIPDRAMALSNQIDFLSSRVDTLIERLAPVLRSHDGSGSEVEAVRNAPATPLGGSLARMADNLRHIDAVLIDALDRLEL